MVAPFCETIFALTFFGDLPDLMLSFFFDGSMAVIFSGNSPLPACEDATETFVAVVVEE